MTAKDRPISMPSNAAFRDNFDRIFRSPDIKTIPQQPHIFVGSDGNTYPATYQGAIDSMNNSNGDDNEQR